MPNGDHRATLIAGSGAGLVGTPVSSQLGFFTLTADANRDRAVSFADLLIIAQQYGQSGRTFDQGNFDYSPDGLVSFSDLLILAQNDKLSLIRAEARPADRLVWSNRRPFWQRVGDAATRLRKKCRHKRMLFQAVRR